MYYEGGSNYEISQTQANQKYQMFSMVRESKDTVSLNQALNVHMT